MPATRSKMADECGNCARERVRIREVFPASPSDWIVTSTSQRDEEGVITTSAVELLPVTVFAVCRFGGKHGVTKVVPLTDADLAMPVEAAALRYFADTPVLIRHAPDPESLRKLTGTGCQCEAVWGFPAHLSVSHCEECRQAQWAERQREYAAQRNGRSP